MTFLDTAVNNAAARPFEEPKQARAVRATLTMVAMQAVLVLAALTTTSSWLSVVLWVIAGWRALVFVALMSTAQRAVDERMRRLHALPAAHLALLRTGKVQR